MKIEHNRRSFVSIGNVLTILGMFGALAVSYATLSADTADTKRRITTLEQRNEETRKEIKEVAQEIKQDVKEVKGNVDAILRKLDSLEAVRQADRRRDRQ
mgnify:CR=1 FL=1